MNGKIYLDSLAEVAEFLKSFVGSTVVFEVQRHGKIGWVIEFGGGY